MNEQRVTFKCGACGNLMAVGVELCGRPVRCPHCQQVIQVPSSAVLLPAPAPPAEDFAEPTDRPPSSPEDVLGLGLEPPELDSIFVEDDPHQVLFGGDSAARLEVPPEPATEVISRSVAPPGSPERGDEIVPPSAGDEATVVFEEASPEVAVQADGEQAAAGVGVAAVEPQLSPARGPDQNPWDQATLETVEPHPPPVSEPAESLAGLAPSRRELAPRRMSLPAKILGIVLPYALLATVAIPILFLRLLERDAFIEKLQAEKKKHPLHDLDNEDLYGHFDRRVRSHPREPSTKPGVEALPTIGLGKTERIGDLDVTPLRVTRQRVVFAIDKGEANVPDGEESLILTLRLRNVSNQRYGPHGFLFSPYDPIFNRQRGQHVYTYLEIGKDQFYGAVTDVLTQRVQGQNFAELAPGEALQTIVVARSSAAGRNAVEALGEVSASDPKQQLHWRVQLRKGQEHDSSQRRFWATTVVLVTFTPADVK